MAHSRVVEAFNFPSLSTVTGGDDAVAFRALVEGFKGVKGNKLKGDKVKGLFLETRGGRAFLCRGLDVTGNLGELNDGEGGFKRRGVKKEAGKVGKLLKGYFKEGGCKTVVIYQGARFNEEGNHACVVVATSVGGRVRLKQIDSLELPPKNPKNRIDEYYTQVWAPLEALQGLLNARSSQLVSTYIKGKEVLCTLAAWTTIASLLDGKC
jgi:hypothetical protein